MDLAVFCWKLCAPMLSMVQEAQRKLAKDEKDDEEPEDLMI